MTAEQERAPSPEPEDRDLVLRSQGGDREAFGLLVRRYQRRVFGLGLRFFGDRDDAEDLVQECFLRAWRAIGRFEAGRPFAPWILRIASNRALSTIESRRRRATEELTESIPWTGTAPDDDLERHRLQESVHRAVDALPDDQRMILVLRAREGLSYREIADLLDVPIGTVMSRLSRARETLRKKVER